MKTDESKTSFDEEFIPKLKAGDSLTLSPEQKEQIDDLFMEAASYDQQVERLCVRAYKTRQSGWDLLRSWFPETEGFEIVVTKLATSNEIVVTVRED